jgi:hypothetical protein
MCGWMIQKVFAREGFGGAPDAYKHPLSDKKEHKIMIDTEQS